MKKMCGAWTLIFTLMLVSCFKDEGNYSYRPVDEITIEGLGEIHRHYSYVMDTLEIIPMVSEHYKEMEYKWLLWSDKGKKIDTIGESKNLAYEVNLKPGRYTVMLKATAADNGYSAIATTELEVTTEFGRGFYILKENTEGNSDLDFSPDGKEVTAENLLQASGLGALPGQPLCIGPVYAHGYIDPVSHKTAACNAVFVTTDQRRVAFYNTEDLSLIQDNENVVYGGLKSEEVPYLAYTVSMMNYFLTDNGFYKEQHEMLPYAPASSAFAKEEKEGGSRFVAPITVVLWGVYPVEAYLYWDARNQSIDLFGAGYGDMMAPYDEGSFSTAGMECLMCGAVASSGKCYFLLQNALGGKYLYECDAATCSTVDRIEIPAGSSLDRAVCYATNAKSADYLYYVTDNRLYAYHLPERREGATPLTLEGMGANEEIVHLSYQWINVPSDETLGTNFTCLVVGTQEGNIYRVHMYDIAGGEPDKLRYSIQGNGRFKSVAYVSPNYDADDYMAPGTSSLPN